MTPDQIVVGGVYEYGGFEARVYRINEHGAHWAAEKPFRAWGIRNLHQFAATATRRLDTEAA